MIQGFDFLDALDAEWVLLIAIGKRIPHQVFEDVFFCEEGIAFSYLQHIALIGELLQGIEVGVQLVVEAAFESAALSAQLGLIDGEILIASCVRIDRFEFGEPGTATEFTSAASDTAYFTGFLTGADLTHFDFDLEFVGVYFDQFAEVDAAIGDVKEGCFFSIGLNLHLADLHVQLELLGDGAAADHGFRFAGFVLFPEIDIAVGGPAQDLLHLRVVFFDPSFFQLQSHDFAGQRYFS